MKARFLFYFLLFLVLFLLGGGLVWFRADTAAPSLINPLGGRGKNFWEDFLRGRERKRGSSPAGGFSSLLTVANFRVPILVHHYVEVVTDERDFVRRSMSIRPDILERQLIYLVEKGYTFITLDELAAANQARLPEKPIILTFDDGYRDFYTDAFPILRKHRIKATAFIVYNFIGKDHNYMDELQIREVVGSGLVEIGSHTLSHRYLTSLPTADAEKEIRESKVLLEKKFGVEVKHFAYPGGFTDETLGQQVEAAGYLTAVGTQKGAVSNDSDLYHLPRLRVGNLSPAELLVRLEKD